MEVVSDALLLAGGIWYVLAAVGVFKFDDTFSRMHAGTKAATLGLLLVVVGTSFRLGADDVVKLAAVAVLAFLTTPVGAHLIGRAAHLRREEVPIRIDTVDELAEAEAAEAEAEGEV